MEGASGDLLAGQWASYAFLGVAGAGEGVVWRGEHVQFDPA